jgi:hypothetical protein
MNLFGHLVGLLGRGMSPTQGLYVHRTTQHRKTRTHIHAPSGIRNRDPSVRAAEDSTCLRRRGHWERTRYLYIEIFTHNLKYSCIVTTLVILNWHIGMNFESGCQPSLTCSVTGKLPVSQCLQGVMCPPSIPLRPIYMCMRSVVLPCFRPSLT